jgi:cupin fold WbuC family metalloprotein
MQSVIPPLSKDEADKGLSQADASTRRRHPKILHDPGDEFNRVVNFIMHDSYMQPHLHPSLEKIEKIHVMEGKMAVLFFDDLGVVTEVTILESDHDEFIAVPAFTWHTYVMLSEHVISFETMMGKYEPETWKEFAQWAPEENTPESSAYLRSLRDTALSRT